jgi:glucose/arabinose dehydrogenase
MGKRIMAGALALALCGCTTAESQQFWSAMAQGTANWSAQQQQQARQQPSNINCTTTDGQTFCRRSDGSNVLCTTTDGQTFCRESY